MRVEARRQSGGVACRPIIGPAAQRVTQRQSSSPLQVACQVAGAEKTVWNQSKKVNCRVSQHGRLLPIAASTAKSWQFIVRCEKIGSR
jgi:hypothetical protein